MVGTGTDQHSQFVEDMEFVPLSGHHIKQEPQDTLKSLESIETTLCTSTMSEVDPMNLLEMLVYASAGEDESLPENSNSVAPKRSQPAEDRWQEWTQGREWLLHDGEDKRQGFCLYCGIKLIVTGYANIKRHETSRSHEERGENYRIFQLSGQWADDSSPTIKGEPGTNSGHVIMKYRRLQQTDALNDFNWERWLLAHNWLERKGKQGTKGYCKYCRLELGVEFSVDRQRHEENMKHKLAAKLYWRQKNRELSHGEEQEQPGITYSAHEQQPDDESDGVESANAADDSQMSVKGPWYEEVSDSSKYCRCRLCRLRMEKRNFYKHIKTRLHHTNVRLYKSARNIQVKGRASEKRDKEIDWRRYTKIHPWLTADPSNGKFAYCTYCKKRFMYGLSIVKRYLHENSASHKQAVAQLNTQDSTRRESNAESSGVANPYENDDDEAENEAERLGGQNYNDEEDEEQGEGEGEDACTTQQGSGDESAQQEGEDNSAAEGCAEESEEHGATEKEKQSQKIIYYPRGSNEWLKIYRCYKKYSKNPAYIYCTICKVPLKKKFARNKHESSTRHRLGLETCSVPSNVQKQPQRRDLTSIYPWLDYSRNKHYRCKFCRVVLSDKYSRKQHELTKRHIMCAQAYLAQNEGVDASTIEEPAARPTVAKQSTQSRVMMWKSRFPWITYKRKETRENYAFCQYCDQSVFVPSPKYASKHQRSSRHLRARAMLRRQREEAKKGVPAEACEESSNGDDEELASNTMGTNVDSFDWLTIDKNDSKVGYCKYCQMEVLISGFAKFQHQSSPAHQKAAAAFLRDQKQSAPAQADRSAGSDDDDGNDESVLSGGIDALSAKSAQDTNNAAQVAESPSKRIRKTTQGDSACSLASRLTSAHSEILSLMREVKSKPRNSNFPQTTPFSIAACLSTVEQDPFAAATTQNSSAIAAAAQKPVNTYDLFFESMCETVKRLPPDLAAESRVKVMQVVYDLELRALQRTQTSVANNTNDDLIATSTLSKPKASGTAAPEPATAMPNPAAAATATTAAATATTAAATATTAASTTGLTAKLRQIRRHSTIEFIPVNGRISPLCKET